jgi:sugar phosphate isomerase/epimerase
MFLSMHNWMRAEPLEVTIRRLAKFGYDSIEIGGEPDKYDTKEVSKLLKENGLRFYTETANTRDYEYYAAALARTGDLALTTEHRLSGF